MTSASSDESMNEFADVPRPRMSRRGVVRAGALALGLGAAPARAAEVPGTAPAAGVRPFRVHISPTVLGDLRRRIAATRWPDSETVADTSQGVPLMLMRSVARYWGEGYDWRRFELYQAPRTWAERAYHNLIYFHEAGKGGHFAAWEQPFIYAAELRAGFRPLRSAL
ncbi:epoxide hydrolase N-terminal domain-containing protein [Kutzneria sp. CA-103260]|uniref:epoxide hydrolase N-terminal domain-containing protein n=1 Tax=Kutzneria sp. CA-103260 TaxID=2802641 RepID=UPI001BF0E44D|nr:epoxide hydrolase N-terminal domain-containing protein [Kutzneria sp. CA-103260]QUQ67132.1 hypothetical protein JJ691_48640 [Kutzneria sp. CA-103260]